MPWDILLGWICSTPFTGRRTDSDRSRPVARDIAKSTTSMASARRRLSAEFLHEQGVCVPAAADRFAVLAQYSPDERVPPSFHRLVSEFSWLGYHVIIASAADGERPLDWSEPLPAGVSVFRRANLGYDFGSWASVLNEYPQVRRAQHVVLANDSMVGPFSSLRPIIGSFERAVADVWGVVRSHQMRPHLQSYFIGYRNGVLDREPLRRFWRRVRVQPTKQAVIERYELGLGRALDRARIRTEAAYDGKVMVGDLNPAIVGWRQLLGAGFPFVKRELLTNPEVVPDASGVPAAVRELYGEDVTRWL